MKVVIFGANGKTGLQLLEQALAKGYKVTAYIRKAGSIVNENPDLKVIVGNLDETLKMTDAIEGADACFVALGGGSLTKHAVEVMNGINNIVKIMEKAGVKRIIYLSSLGVSETRYLLPQPMRFMLTKVLLRIPLSDHNINEQRIIKSKLQWTLVRPGSLTDGPLTGNLKHGSDKTILKGTSSISRANVASFMLDQLTDTTYLNKGVWLYE